MKKLLIGLVLGGIVLMGAGCDLQSSDSSRAADSITTEQNTKILQAAVPAPTLQTSEERKNLAKRLELFNNENKVSYIYLISYGKVMAFYVVKGKITNVDAQLTATQQLVNYNGTPCDNGIHNGANCYVMDSPDLDGTYGTNGDAIFFFTTDGAYVEWKGEYMESDQPLELSTPPELVRTIT